ncbi:hypothetical protein FHS00_001331 [Limimaricola variabilis]|uniref:Uncharacterized protein n=1 Tax=Limimaricola variabilis TaxID=1492771 RepID=A0ABR6HMG4_9RHOB|nr:hypothetical protein [Limimaricola variabilis]MBB3711760.1 hypothetical protein [Limimaricola variabilis]
MTDPFFDPLAYLPPDIPPSVAKRALPRIEGAWKKLRAMSVEKLQSMAAEAEADFALPHRLSLSYNKTGGLVGVSLRAVSVKKVEEATSGHFVDLHPFLPHENSIQLALWEVYVVHSRNILHRRHGERPFLGFDDEELSQIYSAGHVKDLERRKLDPMDAKIAAPQWALQLEAGHELHIRKHESNHDKMERHAAQLARRKAAEVVE